MARIAILLMVMFMLFSCAGIGSYNPKEHNSHLFNLYWHSDQFDRKLSSDIHTFGELQKQQITVLLEAKALPEDGLKVSKALWLIDSVDGMLRDYTGRDDLLLGTPSAPLAWGRSNDVYIWGVQATADMRIRLGKAYARLGKKEEAEEMLRSVVINYTGTAYQSQVREAQFALGDLN